MEQTLKFILVISLFVHGSLQGYSQDCRVEKEEIRGSYEGECKKGRADGFGKSIGKDTYEGKFKKGMPSGFGTYTFSNGDIYKGEFKRGLKDGKGELTVLRLGREDSIVNGYWADDEYLGTEKTKYKINSRCPEVVTLSLNRTGDIDQLQIMFTLRSQPISVEGLNVTGIYGEGVQQARSTVYNNITYPWEGSVRFTYYDTRKTGPTLQKSCEIVLDIFQPGTWKMRIDLRDEE